MLKKYGVLYEQFLQEKPLEAIRIEDATLDEIAYMCSHASNGAQVAAPSVVL